MPGQEIVEVDRTQINPKFICTMCEMLLVEPMQTHCGHLLCRDCVQTILSTSNPVCPKDGTELKENKIFSDGIIRRELLALHLQCPNSDCTWSGSYEELQDHSKCCSHLVIKCVHGQCKMEIKQHLLAQHLTKECYYHLQCTNSPQVSLIPNALLETVTALETRVQNLESFMEQTTVTLSDTETMNQVQAATSYNGILLWKIDDFNRKRVDAVNEVQTAMYSPQFYSGQYGYKMCAKIYLNGDGLQKGTHISLFFVVMKGEYDALLPWPFQKNIIMMLIDQNNENHITYAFRSDPQCSSSQRPSSEMNTASGSPVFMSLDGSLDNHAYIKDDVMFIGIVVQD